MDEPTIARDAGVQLSGLFTRMELAFGEALLAAPDDVPDDIRETLDNMQKILKVDVDQRLKEAAADTPEGTDVLDRKVRHELRNKMSVLMGFSDLLVYTGRAQGEFGERLKDLRSLSEQFTGYL